MCKSDGCCHGSAGAGLGAVPGDVASGSVKAVGAAIGLKLAAGLVLAAGGVLVAVARDLGSLVPLAVTAVYGTGVVLCVAGVWAARTYRHRPLYRPPVTARPRPVPAVEAPPARLAIDNRHVIPAWTDYERQETRAW